MLSADSRSARSRAGRLGAGAFALTLAIYGLTGCAEESDPSGPSAEALADDEQETSEAQSSPRGWWTRRDGGRSLFPFPGARRDAGSPTAPRDAATEPAPDPEPEPAHDAGGGHQQPGEGVPDECFRTPADPRDNELTGKPDIVKVGNSQDTMLPKPVLDWMKEREWDESHDGWHLIRLWDQGCRKSNASGEGCASAQRLVSKGLWRAPNQQGAPGEGVEFLAFHRHMIQQIKQAFPKHADLFSSFKHIPKSKADPENPHPWRNISWSQGNLRGFEILENIEKNVGMFADEDDLGHYIESSFKWTPERPTVAVSRPGQALHGAMHAQWAVSGSPGSLINQAIDLRNWTFWKLHGWIDDVWERYRKAKGLSDSDPAYQKVLVGQCKEMHDLAPSRRKGGGTVTPEQPSQPESGFFAQSVRPILETTCSGCHSVEGSAMGGLVLGGKGISSAEVMKGLVGVKATNERYDLVKPGNPEQSWLYLKASGGAATVACTSSCDRTAMPPSGQGLTAAQLSTLRQWIANGAKAD